MANNIFGIPVNDSVVFDIYPALRPSEITAEHRADVALINMNANDRASNARAHAQWLKDSYGTGTTTLGCIYNATGGTLRFITSHTWEGSVWRDPYPQVLQNGQWGAFLHVRWRLMGPCKEAIVYRGQNNAGQSRDWVLAWDTSRRHFQNYVYTDIRVGGSTINWDAVDRSMANQGLHLSVTNLGCFSSVSLGSGSSPNYTGIMTLDGLTPRAVALATDISAIFPSLDSKYNDDEGVPDEEEETPTAPTAAAPPPAAPAPAPAPAPAE